jgi:hypothetical protein
VVASGYVAKVMVDFDSTINKFDEHVIGTLNNVFGSEYLPEHVTTWDFLREMDPDHVKYTWGEKMYHSREWTLSIPMQPIADIAIAMLQANNYYVRVVTARTGQHLEWVEEWLRMRGIRNVSVTCVDKDTGDKAKWCQRYGYTIAIEDAPHHVMQLAETVPTVYMIEKLYNSHIAKVPHPFSSVIRVKSLLEAAERIIDGERSGSEANVGNDDATGRAGDTDSFVPGQSDQSITNIRGIGVGAV